MPHVMDSPACRDHVMIALEPWRVNVLLLSGTSFEPLVHLWWLQSYKHGSVTQGLVRRWQKAHLQRPDAWQLGHTYRPSGAQRGHTCGVCVNTDHSLLLESATSLQLCPEGLLGAPVRQSQGGLGDSWAGAGCGVAGSWRTGKGFGSTPFQGAQGLSGGCSGGQGGGHDQHWAVLLIIFHS